MKIEFRGAKGTPSKTQKLRSPKFRNPETPKLLPPSTLRQAFRLARFVLAILVLRSAVVSGQLVRQELELSGKWRLTAGGVTREVIVPDTFERQIAADFDGVGIYEREVAPQPIPDHQRLLLEFDGVATETTVWFHDVELGRHLGAWTPFTFDVTDVARAASSRLWRIRVKVDEKVGHNTQGFLPVIQPHFGGIWQCVRLRWVPEAWFDRGRILLIGQPSTGHLQLRVPLSSRIPPDKLRLTVDMTTKPQTGPLRDPSAENASPWVTLGQFQLGASADIADAARNTVAQWRDGELSATLPTRFTAGQSWSPEQPQRFVVRLRLDSPHGRDEVTLPVAFRAIEIRGDQWLLNGRPLMIRGLLNWGYAPPKTSPSLDPSWMSNEIKFARSCGFNLMKFCLWIPPRTYLELCDELGMMAWMEYPTWHPKLTRPYLEELSREYVEFFELDRNHPSVILRSLTCETTTAYACAHSRGSKLEWRPIFERVVNMGIPPPQAANRAGHPSVAGGRRQAASIWQAD